MLNPLRYDAEDDDVNVFHSAGHSIIGDKIKNTERTSFLNLKYHPS